MRLEAQYILANPAPASHGFHIFGASASTGYTSLLGDLTNVNRSVYGTNGDFFGEGSFSAGYTSTRSTRSFNLIYTGSFTSRVRFSDLHSFNQALSFDMTRSLSPRLTLTNRMAAGILNAQQFVFDPNIQLSSAVGSTSLDDLRQLSGAALSARAAQPYTLLLYGDRVLSLNYATGLNYNYSPRLHLSGSLGFSTAQEQTDGKSAAQQIAVGKSRSQQGVFDIRYSLTTRSDLSTTLKVNKVHSVIGDYLLTDVGVTYGRTLRPNWYSYVSLGVGQFRSTQLGGRSADSWTAGAGLLHRSQNSTIALNLSKQVGDSYGIGSTSLLSALSSYTWRRPARRWGIVASAGGQRFSGGLSNQANVYQITGGIARTLSAQLNADLSYVHVISDFHQLGTARTVGVDGVRLTFTWAPTMRRVARTPVPDRTEPDPTASESNY